MAGVVLLTEWGEPPSMFLEAMTQGLPLTFRPARAKMRRCGQAQISLAWWLMDRYKSLEKRYTVLVGGLEHEFYDFPYIGNNHPNWRTHIFQRGRAQPPTSILKDPILQQPEMLEVCWPWRATARSGSLRGSPCIEVGIAGDDWHSWRCPKMRYPTTIDFNTEIVYDCLILDDF